MSDHAPFTQPLEPPPPAQPGGLTRLWESLVRMGLGEPILKIGTGAASVALFLLVVWVMEAHYLKVPGEQPIPDLLAETLQTASPAPDLPEWPIQVNASMLAGAGGPVDPASSQPAAAVYSLEGIPRLAEVHTILPARPRFDVVPYTVVAGDTIFGIAGRFNLNPETVLWGNYYTLYDNPHLLQPGMELNILPVDGVYHKWSAGEGLNGVAEYYGVQPADIVSWPGNHLNLAEVGSFAAPNIEPGTMLVVPGGRREFTSWITPRITRTNPKTAISVGPGYCEAVPDGVVGGGTFLWPAPTHYLSGYDYSPSTNHFGIDIAGETGDPIYASDHGIVVYSGWNNHGYGNVIVIDHGNGWQTVYAHLDQVGSPCGASVYQGTVIGAMGSTGNSSGSHLHFEMYSDQYGKANPWDYVQ
jgi:hypothetical protein